MNVPFSPPLISDDEIDAVVAVLRTGWISTGPRVGEFEQRLQEYLHVHHVVALNSCTAALHLSLLTHGVGPGDEVVTTPMTFAATANVVVHCGARPVFADIKKDEWNIDPSQVRKKITRKTKAIIPVHLGGLPCDLEELQEIAHEKRIPIIEDAAHALGAKYGRRKIGASGNTVCFSFYPTKNITTVEGGAIVTKDKKTTDLIKVLRIHGQSADAWKRHTTSGIRSYQVTRAGYKYNMTDVQAVLGIKQLEKIDGFLEARKKVARVYLEELKNEAGLVLPVPDAPKKQRVWHLFSLLIKSEELGITRDAVVKKLIRAGIGTGIHYEALNLHPFYRSEFGYHQGMYPSAEYVSSRTLSLPLSAAISEEQAARVVRVLRSILRRG